MYNKAMYNKAMYNKAMYDKVMCNKERRSQTIRSASPLFIYVSIFCICRLSSHAEPCIYSVPSIALSMACASCMVVTAFMSSDFLSSSLSVHRRGFFVIYWMTFSKALL